MPSIVTHYTFANEVLKKLNKININKDLYNVYAQSFDYFFYYNFLDIKNGKKVRNFGRKCHKSNTQFYFLNLIKNIKEQKLEKDPNALAYLYGSITHYVLDYTCHPFIFYKTGCYYKDDKTTNKYRGMHTKMEINIDAFFSKQYFKKMLYNLDIRNEIIGNVIFPSYIIELMNQTFFNTYNIKNMGKYYVKGYNSSKKVFSLLRQDKRGIKKKIYKFLDLFIKKGPKLEYYSTYIRNENINYLNIQRKEWYNPCSKEKFNDSFIDLYTKSINKAIKIITSIDEVLNNKSDIKTLTKIIGNYSYTTGLLIEKNKNFTKFEY